MEIDPAFRTKREQHLTADLLRQGWGALKSKVPSLQNVEDWGERTGATPIAEGAVRALAPGDTTDLGLALLGPAGKVGRTALKAVGGATALSAGMEDAEAASGGKARKAVTALLRGAEPAAARKAGGAVEDVLANVRGEPVLGGGGSAGFLDTSLPAAEKTKVPLASAKRTLRQDIEAAANPPIIDRVLGAQLADRYPMPGPPELKPKQGKPGVMYEAKKQSPEEAALWNARKKAQAEIDKGNYEPYYDVEQRFHTDPADFPRPGNTQVMAQPAKQATREQYAAQWDTPEVEARLQAAYDKGAKDPMADRWYGMGQLVNDFKQHLGPIEGPKSFRSNFSDPMGATTARATPEANLMQSAYGNYLRTHDLPLPEASHQYPSPLASPDTVGNQELYNRVITQGEGLSAADQPKRHNFSSNFEGHTDRGTIDTRMMSGVDPTGTHKAPPGMTYGTIEAINNRIAQKAGDTAADAQAKMWVGLGDETTKPMIQTVNEAIERTHRITGKPKADIVRDSLIKGTHPLYGVAGLGGAAALSSMLRNPPEEQ